jgi:hypothetical protein
MRIARMSIVAILLTLSSPAWGREIWFVIIAGVNRPLHEGEAPLRYAGNDALKYFEFFGQFTQHVQVFTELDADSRGYPEQLRQAVRTPRRGALLATFRRMNRQMARLRREEPSTVTRFFFIFSGHAGEDRAGSYLNVLSEDERRVERLTKLELWRDVLGTSAATRNHVILDACFSGSFVTAGQTGRRPELFTREWRDFLRRSPARRDSFPAIFARTTFFLSSDALGKSHEYREFRGGVFTHELLSALKGAADLDGDGRVTYPEIRAFLAAANRRPPGARISGVRFEPRMIVPDGERGNAFVDFTLLRAGTLLVAKSLHGRFFLLDEAGRRYADFHKTADYAVKITLLSQKRYTLYHDGPAGRSQLTLPPKGRGEAITIEAVGEAAPLPAVSHGGPVEEALSRLFESPLEAPLPSPWEGIDSPEPLVREHLEELQARDATRRHWRYALFTLGGAASVTAGAFAGRALFQHSRYTDPHITQIQAGAARDSYQNSLYALIPSLGSAAAAFLVGALAFGEESAGSALAAPMSRANRRRYRYVLYALGASATALAVGLTGNIIAQHQTLMDSHASRIALAEAIQSRRSSVIGVYIGLGMGGACFLTGAIAFREEVSPSASILAGFGLFGARLSVEF